MSTPTHQTVKLSKGKHSSPSSGACVMELASMLAGEQFSDHPRSVCPVIGSFLRAYNDSIDDDHRQDLYEYASRVVGSRSTAAIEQLRADRIAEWCAQVRSRRWTRYILPPRLEPLVFRRQAKNEAIGAHAVQAIRRHSDETHAAVLDLLDELLAIRLPQRQLAPALPAADELAPLRLME